MPGLIPKDIRGLILDIDGVLWKDAQPIGNLPAIFAKIEQRGLKVILATNNATRTVDQYLEKLYSFGVTLAPWQVITSSLATAYTLAKHFPEGGDVYMIGEAGLLEALIERGFMPIDTPNSSPLAVVAGMDRGVTYSKLRQATLYIRSGVPFYGTNPDRTFPTPIGLVPGAGSILAALEAASDTTPIIIGKPAPYMMEIALKLLDVPKKQALVIGDRLETDIAGGQAVGSPTALVLSGVSTRELGEAWQPPIDIIANDLSELLEI